LENSAKDYWFQGLNRGILILTEEKSLIIQGTIFASDSFSRRSQTYAY
jgi:hypothetical protein